MYNIINEMIIQNDEQNCVSKDFVISLCVPITYVGQTGFTRSLYRSSSIDYNLKCLGSRHTMRFGGSS